MSESATVVVPEARGVRAPPPLMVVEAGSRDGLLVPRPAVVRAGSDGGRKAVVVGDVQRASHLGIHHPEAAAHGVDLDLAGVHLDVPGDARFLVHAHRVRIQPVQAQLQKGAADRHGQLPLLGRHPEIPKTLGFLARGRREQRDLPAGRVEAVAAGGIGGDRRGLVDAVAFQSPEEHAEIRNVVPALPPAPAPEVRLVKELVECGVRPGRAVAVPQVGPSPDCGAGERADQAFRHL